MSTFGRLSSAAVLTLLCLTAGCRRSAEGNHGDANGGLPPIRVTAIRPERKTLVRTIELPGRTEAFEVTPLYAKVTGYVEKMSVDIGDLIRGPHDGRQGDILCELEVPELKEELAEKSAVVQQTKAEVLLADAAVKVAEAGLRSVEAKLREAQAAAAREEAKFTRWQSEYQRISKLAESGVVTKKVADETRAELEAADAGRNEVVARIASAEAQQQESAAQLEKAKADAVAMRSRLAVAEAEERRLEAMHNYSIIRAPYDGVVVERNAHTGHLIQSGGGSQQKAVLTVMRVDPIRVFVDAPEGDAVYVSTGSKVELRLPSLNVEPYVGQVTRTSWSLNATSRTLLVEIDVPNSDGKWRPGQFVSARITIAELPDVISLPKTAVVTQEKQTYCFVVAVEGRLVRQPIELGLQAGTEFEVRSGLTGSEQVIGVNANAFREGQTVELAQPSK